MKRNKIIILSVASLLVILVVAIVLIRRRGRKVYVRNGLSGRVYLYGGFDGSEFQSSLWYEQVLEYVVLPFDWENKTLSVEHYNEGMVDFINASNPFVFVPVKAVGVLDASGKVRKIVLKETQYINKKDLENI